jgi:hypothetical protein
MFHKLEKVTLVTSNCSAATETNMLLHHTSVIEYFVDNIIIIYSQGLYKIFLYNRNLF